MNTLWEADKRVHRQLAADAGADYEQTADNEFYATAAYMDYEARFIAHHASEAVSLELAVELGCGTGRLAFELARRFKRVHGYDFCEESIRQATIQKAKVGAENISFEVRDVETGFPALGTDSVSFLVAGFGMGSFFQNLDDLSNQVQRVLCPEGLAVFSFYNSDALVYLADARSRSSLAAKICRQEPSRVEVNPGNGHTYIIPAQSYSPDFIERHMRARFELIRLVTFPTVLSLLPNSFFEQEEHREILLRVDEAQDRFAGGAYILAAVRNRNTMSA